MTKRNFARAAAIGAALAFGTFARAQFVAQPSEEPSAPLITPIEDPGIEQAQFTQPVRANETPGAYAPGSGTRVVSDPPPPVVRIQVRVPADAPPGDDLKYVIVVQNTSQADAHQVAVRNPIPEGALQVTKAEPQPDAKLSSEKQVVWKFGTLKGGEKRTIELHLKPKPDAKEVKNLAYVQFEHGEAVTTKINRPVVKVTKQSPKETVRGEPFTVRVIVENTGRVPAEKVRIVENVERSAEVEAMTVGASRT